ncbi:MAG: phosphatase PAP2 family protein [Candidatus Omnitrophota bacterium]
MGLFKAYFNYKKLALWAFHGLMISILLYFDTPMYRGFQSALQWMNQQSFILYHEIVKLRHWRFFNEFGCAWAGILICYFIWEYDRENRKKIVVLAVSALISVSIYTVLQATVGKLRPSVTDGVATYLPFLIGWQSDNSLSFPSGHATFAFTLASFLALLYPRRKYFFLLIATATALARIYFHAHYFSDIYAGGVIGFETTNFVYFSYEWITAKKGIGLNVSAP